jgi:hypothetical protein
MAQKLPSQRLICVGSSSFRVKGAVMRKTNKKASTKKPISQALRRTIRKRKLTAYATAKQAGVSVDAVQRFLKDERGLSLETVDKIADCLDLVLCDDSPAEQNAD